MVMGEDVGRAGGVFRATAGLRDRFGADRCVDTPLAEAGILGSAVGLCMAGLAAGVRDAVRRLQLPLSRPADHARGPLPLADGREDGVPAHRSACRTAAACARPSCTTTRPRRTTCTRPGVKVAIPSTPADAKGLLAAAIRDPDPVVVFEPKLHYRTMRGEVPEGEHVVPLGKARLAREGSDLTLVAYGAMVPLAEQAADELAGEA